MSTLIPGEKESAKRRRVEEGTGESERKESGGRSRSASSRGSCGSRLGGAASDAYEELVGTAYAHWEEHNKETGDLFSCKEDFKEKVTRTTAKDWGAACRSLVKLAERDAATLRGLAALDEPCGSCAEKRLYMADLATDQYERYDWALREYAHRYREAVKEAKSLAKEKEERMAKEDDWEERTRRLTAEKREAEIERDRLRAALTTREEAGGGEGTTPPPPRNTGPEMMELGEETPSPSSGDVAIPAALLGALETWLEKKWEQLAFRWIPPPTGEKREVSAAKEPGSWAKAVGRKAEKKSSPDGTSSPILGEKRRVPIHPSPAVRSKGARTGQPKAAPPSSTRTGRKEKRWPALPGSAVVAICPIPGETQAGVERMMREAQQELSLEEIGVPPLEVKRSKMGGYLLGVKGQGAEAGADRLAEGLRGLPGASGVKVSRPAKTRDIRVSGLNAGVTPEEVAHSVAAAGGCPTEDIKPGAVKCSPLGMGTLWLRCPIATAVKVARARGVRVGWIWAPVELLEPRPDRCFRCLEPGHLRLQCASRTDRSTRCYRCGRAGHAAKSCEEAVPRCPLCGDVEGRDSCHVLGGSGCMEAPPQRQPTAKKAARATLTGIT